MGSKQETMNMRHEVVIVVKHDQMTLETAKRLVDKLIQVGIEDALASRDEDYDQDADLIDEATFTIR
jgi:hypothetical protein